MVFSSLNFMFIFFPLVLGIDFLSPRPVKNLILFLASLVFYAWGRADLRADHDFFHAGGLFSWLDGAEVPGNLESKNFLGFVGAD